MQDVDDLISTADLEMCVSQSAVAMILLGSPRYFSSTNCMREVQAAQEDKKPLALLHEAYPGKNGTPRLNELEAACSDKYREFIFGVEASRPTIVRWLRDQNFQRVSLKCLAEQLLNCLAEQCQASMKFTKDEMKYAASMRCGRHRMLASRLPACHHCGLPTSCNARVRRAVPHRRLTLQ